MEILKEKMVGFCQTEEIQKLFMNSLKTNSNKQNPEKNEKTFCSNKNDLYREKNSMESKLKKKDFMKNQLEYTHKNSRPNFAKQGYQNPINLSTPYYPQMAPFDFSFSQPINYNCYLNTTYYNNYYPLKNGNIFLPPKVKEENFYLPNNSKIFNFQNKQQIYGKNRFSFNQPKNGQMMNPGNLVNPKDSINFVNKIGDTSLLSKRSTFHSRTNQNGILETEKNKYIYGPRICPKYIEQKIKKSMCRKLSAFWKGDSNTYIFPFKQLKLEKSGERDFGYFIEEKYQYNFKKINPNQTFRSD